MATRRNERRFRSWRSPGGLGKVDTRDATLEVVGDPTLLGNPRQLRLLLANLFRNCVDHGGIDVTVRVGAVDDGFFVEDAGGGIPSPHRERVHDPGYTTGHGGSGVGLTIVQRIADDHDWSVGGGESAEGGARFTFSATGD